MSIAVGEYVPRALRSFAPSTRSGWATYARVLCEGAVVPVPGGNPDVVPGVGDVLMSDVVPSDLQPLLDAVMRNAALSSRVTNAGGRSAGEGFVSMVRGVWRVALADKALTGVSENIGLGLEKPKRAARSSRRALTPAELRAIETAIVSSSDPELGLLVFRTFLETGCRRNELLGLTYRSLLRTDRAVNVLKGAKGGSFRKQPVTRPLFVALDEFAAVRSGSKAAKTRTPPDAPLFVNRKGQAITHRYLEDLARHIRATVPALNSEGAVVHFTWHLLRHTTATFVERVAGFATANAFLGHSTSGVGGSGLAVTLRYTKADFDDVRRAIEAIFDPPEGFMPEASSEGSGASARSVEEEFYGMV